MKQSMVFKKLNEKKLLELKKVCNHYLDKRKNIYGKTQFKFENIFGYVINKDNFCREQITN